jgi:GT2 family glycosyltransferase
MSPTPEEGERREISVVIPTYRRPESLEEAILSCISQKRVEGRFEIIVVDNDEKGSAKPTICAISKETRVPIFYIKESRPGISWARNTGVAAAKGSYLVFLDDDEVAAPEWLDALLKTINCFGADIAIGPVLPRFPDPESHVHSYAKKIYTRDAAVPSGTVLEWGSGGNCMIRPNRCFAGPTPFDIRLAISGGEDAVFFRQARSRGCKLVWCAEALVWETIPADKLSTSYLLRRAFRGGQTTTFMHLATTPMEVGPALRSIFIGCAQAVVYGLAGGVLLMAGHSRWLHFVAKAAGGLGKIAWHPFLYVSLYRRK